MAATKITDLAALLGQSFDLADVFVVVDTSDTSMASSGTDKKATAANVLLAGFALGLDRAPNVSVTIPAGRGSYIVDSFEVGDGLTLEISDGAVVEVG